MKIEAPTLLAMTYLEEASCVSAIQRLLLRGRPTPLAGIRCAGRELVTPAVAHILFETANLVADLLVGGPGNLGHHFLDRGIFVRLPVRATLLRDLAADELADGVLLAVGEGAVEILVEFGQFLAVAAAFLEEVVSKLVFGEVVGVAGPILPCFKGRYLFVGEDAAMLFDVLG